jgi:hypothetical protein
MPTSDTKPIELRARIERSLTPMVEDLRSVLAKYPTVLVLNYYLGKAHAARVHDIEMPDGYWQKFRYMWAILLSLSWKPYDSVDPDDLDFAEIDQRIEEIFNVYRVGAIYDPGKVPGSRREFLARMGWAIRVLEPDVLAFPEQIRDWALMKFAPFDVSFFRPRLGNSASEIFGWVSSLIETVGDRSDHAITEGYKVRGDLELLRGRFVENPSDIASIREDGEKLRLEDRLVKNGEDIAQLHIFSREELRGGLAYDSDGLIELLAIDPGRISTDFTFPHDENPLEFRSLVALPDGSYYFLDPASSYRLVGKALERQILAADSFRDRYLKKRDKLTESFVADRLRSIFSDAEIHQNYYPEKGQLEKDILVRNGDTVILIECKNSRVRGFAGGGDDLIKYDTDFERSVQYAYDQALDVKQRVSLCDEAIFYDDKGREAFKLRRSEIKRFFIACVAITPRGEFGTDLSYLLQKPADEPYPLSINLFDFDTVAKYLKTPELFLGYLAARESLHGRVHTGDELNLAGYFLKNGDLTFPDGMLIDDTHSAVFDRGWYAEKGIHVEEPTDGPVITTVERKGNTIIVEDPISRHEVTVPPYIAEFVARTRGVPMTGAVRNHPCACGSGKKAKSCCGLVRAT